MSKIGLNVSLRVILILTLFLTMICFSEANEDKFVLQRIKAESGDGSEVKVMLRTGRFAKGEIYDMTEKNTKKDFIQEAPGEMIIVSNGHARLYSKDQHTLVINGEFLVDKSLKMTVKGSWNGNKNGAVHMLMGKITIFDYEFDSNSKYPFIFKITDDGYEYQGGSGRVKDLQTGEVYVLFAQGKAIDEFEGNFFQRLSCEKECCELLLKEQIKQGLTIEECVRSLCK